MALRDSCVFWNKLGSAGEIGTSEIGANGSISGTVTYGAVKFGNGVKPHVTAGSGNVTFTNAVSDARTFVLSYWVKAGTAWNSGVIHDWVYYHKPVEITGIQVYHDTTNLFQIIVYQSGANKAVYNFNLTYSAGEVFHLCIVFNASGGAGAKLAMYKNGSPVTVASSPTDNAWTWTTGFSPKFISNNGTNDNFSDNLKLYNNISLISDILTNDYTWEGFQPLAPGNLSASDGLFAKKIELSWDGVSDVTGYKLYKSIDDITYNLIETTANTVYDDTDVIPGITYYYKVLAYDAYGDGILSASETGYVEIGTVSGLTASDGTYTTHVALDWSYVGATDIDGYNIYRSTNGVTYSSIGTSAIASYNDETAVAGTIYYYKIAAYAGAYEGTLSSADTGYRAIKVFNLTCVPVQPKVTILTDEIDIYDLGYIEKLISVTTEKTFKRDKLIINEITQEVKNFDNFFSVDNSLSIFNAINWVYGSYKIYDTDNNIIWDGIITSISRDHDKKTATITSMDRLYKYMKYKIEYTSTDWETPASAFKNICDQIGYTQYNFRTVQASINQYTANGCYIKCYVKYKDNITFQQIVEKLSEIGCADTFSFKNELYFKHWKPYTGGVKAYLVEDDLLSGVSVDVLEKEIINEYRIGYYGDAGTPVTDSGIGTVSQARFGIQELPEMSCREGSQIIIKDITSAKYIGETYIKRTNYNYINPRPLTVIAFEIKWNNKEWLDMESYFRLTYSAESWDQKLFEVFELSINYDKNIINVVAYEVEE